MLGKGDKISDSIDFDNVMFFGNEIIGWQNGKIINNGGKITKHTEQAVYINGGYYLKAVCEFRVR